MWKAANEDRARRIAGTIRIGVFVLLGFCLSTSRGIARDDLLAWLPKETSVYGSWVGLEETARIASSNRLYRLLHDPMVLQNIEEPLADIQEWLEQTRVAAAPDMASLSEIVTLVSGPVSFAIGPTGVDSEPTPFVIAVDLRHRHRAVTESVLQAFETFLSSYSADVEPPRPIRGVSVRPLAARNDVELYSVRLADHALIGVGFEYLQAILECRNDPAAVERLDDEPSIQRFNETVRGPTLFRVFVRTQPLLSRVPTARVLLRSLGLDPDAVRAIGVASIPENDGLRDLVYLDTDDPGKGLAARLAGATSRADSALPASPRNALATGYGLWNPVELLVPLIEGGDALARCFGDSWDMSVRPGFPPQAVVSIAATRADDLRAWLPSLARQLGVKVEQRSVEGYDYLCAVESMVPIGAGIRPAIIVLDHRMVVATSPELLESRIGELDSAAATSGRSRTGTLLSIDPRPFLPIVELTLLGHLRQQSEEENWPSRIHLLPAASTVTRYVRPTMINCSSTDQGLLVESVCELNLGAFLTSVLALIEDWREAGCFESSYQTSRQRPDDPFAFAGKPQRGAAGAFYQLQYRVFVFLDVIGYTFRSSPLTNRLGRPVSEVMLACLEKLLGERHMATSYMRYAVAFACELEGDFERAVPLFRRSLDDLERALGLHPVLLIGMNEFARSLVSIARYDEARQVYEKILRIRESQFGPDSPYTAQSYMALAAVCSYEGNYGDAQHFLERAIGLWQGRPAFRADLARARGSRGAIFASLGRYDEAREELESSFDLHTQLFGPSDYWTLQALRNLSAVCGVLHEHEKHVEYARTTLSGFEANHGTRSRETIIHRDNLALALAELGEFSAAEELHVENIAISMETLGRQHPLTIQARNHLAFLHLRRGEYRQAWDLVRETCRDVETYLAATLAPLPEAERFLVAEAQRGVIRNLLRASAHLSDESIQRETYEALLHWKGWISRDLMSSRRRLHRDASPEVVRLLDEQRRIRRQISTLSTSNYAPDDTRDDRLDELRRSLSRIERDVQRRTAPAEARDVSLGDLREAMPAGSAFVDFSRHWQEYGTDEEDSHESKGAIHLNAWLLRQEDGVLRRINLGPSDDIKHVAEQFLRRLVGLRRSASGTSANDPRGQAPPREGESAQDLNHRVRRLLWDPLYEHLAGIELILVSGGGFLGAMPLEVLRHDDGDFLIEHHQFVYLQDMASLPDISSRPPVAGRGLLTVGGVDYGAREEPSPEPESDAWKDSIAMRGPANWTDWSSLSYTGSESDTVYRLHESRFGAEHPRRSLSGTAATEERLKRELSGFSFLHLATHGFFMPETMRSVTELSDQRSESFHVVTGEKFSISGYLPGLLSGLVLSGANLPADPRRENGLLTAEEVSILDLSDCELVVLSACRTALGKERAGEGMVGLRRAFRQAGARTVISSLWSVGDESTSKLMKSFYRRLWVDGHSRLGALRGAQLEMLQRQREDAARDVDASAWGGFVLSGDWR